MTRKRLLATTIIGGLAMASAGAAVAQTAPESDSTEIEAVVVTGSRIARPDYVSNSPIVSVGQEQLAKSGSVTVDTLLNQMPQFVPGVSSTSNNPSNGGQANIQLRGLGSNRTLVLMDGHRIVPSNSDGTVDVNLIPSAIIQNIEVITGGASATYGSDAMAGVVNFKINDRFQGLQVDAQYGITDAKDGEESSISITGGSRFADDKGHAIMSLSYSTRGEILNAARKFSSVSGASATTPYGRYDFSGTNLPTQAAMNAVFAQYGIAPGTVAADSNLGFNNDGTLFRNGTNYRGSTAIDYSTIPLDGSYNTGPLNLLQLPMTRYSAFGMMNYDITENVEAYGSFNFTHYDSRTILAPSPAAATTGFSVNYNNPFVPTDLRTLLASRADPTADFLFRKRFTDVGPRISETTFNVFQLTTGLRGQTNFRDWTWDLFGSYGKSEQNEIQRGNVSRAAVVSLLDAADGGTSICAGGYNPFGLQPLSAECASYISRVTKNWTSYEQRAVELNLQGGLFDLPAGEVRAAVGTSYRSDKYNYVPDSLLSTGDVIGFNANDALDASADVYDLYGEVLVPVLKDLPFIKALNVTGGYRFSDYNTVGSVSAYKVDGDWEVVDGIRLRGGYSRGVRAPSIGELYSPQAQNFPQIIDDPCSIDSRARTGPNAAAVRSLCLAQGVPSAIIDSYTYPNTQVNALVGGNPDLKEETADTYSVGLVWTPRFEHPLFEKLSASVDYYSIKIKDAIGTVDAGLALTKCYDGSAGSSFYCGLFDRSNQTGEIQTLVLTNLNLATYETAGVDFQIDWGFGLGAIGLSDDYGSLAFNIVGNYLDKFDVQSLPGEPIDKLKGTIGNTSVSAVAVAKPEWKVMSSATYSFGPAELGVRWRFVDSMVDAGDNSEKIKSVNYFDLNGAWKVTDMVEVRAGVYNVADKQPPVFSSNIQANTDPSTYDVLGRRFYLALKTRF
ncbi:TonB-dependent receptor [Caulobacter sp. 602-2]|uniref:TonB-dependent receptor n=1 Tax=Caulobacter sp. 602-2 TaxID=2710887 RepID=A0A6G4QZX8_9CAUL|nr:TonB-dependent receptor [Caulobacter sp. 602-2]NGM50488.1 TonB-dependent receptor [Caulobacter sp. 602-2]